MRFQFFNKFTVWLVLGTFFFSTVTPAVSGPRVMPTDTVQVFDGKTLVQVLKKESVLPNGVLLAPKGRCGVRMENLYLVAEDGAVFGIVDDMNKIDLRVDKGLVYFALTRNTGQLAFVTPAGLIFTRQVVLHAAADGGLLKGYLHVKGSQVGLGVLEGGSMLVSTDHGDKKVLTGKQIMLAMADPIKKEDQKELDAKEKESLVQQGVDQYKKGMHDQARQNLELARKVFPENYAAPYYLGLIYLEQGKRAAAIAEWQQYIKMDPDSENALRIRKNLTVLMREEALDSAKTALANEAALTSAPAAEDTVAISAFNNLGSENIAPLGKGMAALLIHDLSQVSGLQVVERVRMQALLQEMNLGTSGLVTSETAPRVGKLLKAKHVTSGSLADLEKENLQIASALMDTEVATRIKNQEAQGELKKFYDLEKQIACQIVEDLDRNCDEAPAEFKKTHTKSLAALLFFSAGLNYLDQQQNDRARESFQRAVEEDPSFQLAQEALLDTPDPEMQYGSEAMGTTEEMIAVAAANGVSTDTAGNAMAYTSAAGGVGALAAAEFQRIPATYYMGGAVLLGGAGSLILNNAYDGGPGPASPIAP